MSLNQIRNLVTGGAGFLGSHLIDKLMNSGQEVVCIDNFYTGRKSNLNKWLGNPKFEIIRHDITEPILVEVDRIWHLACPASPIQYQSNPIKTAKTSFLGTYNMLGLARRTRARARVRVLRLVVVEKKVRYADRVVVNVFVVSIRVVVVVDTVLTFEIVRPQMPAVFVEVPRILIVDIV